VPNIVSVALLTGNLDLNFWVKAVSILFLSFTVCHFHKSNLLQEVYFLVFHKTKNAQRWTCTWMWI